MAAVQINLLEEKEQKNMVPVLLITGAGIIILLLLFIFWWQAKSMEAETTQLEAELQQLDEREAELNSASTDELSSQRQALQSAVERLEERDVSVASMLREMVALLPERGYMEYFALKESGDVSIEVRLDNLQQTAAYLDALDTYERSGEVRLSSVTGEEPAGDVDPFDYRVPYLASYTVHIPDFIGTEEEVAQDEVQMEP